MGPVEPTLPASSWPRFVLYRRCVRFERIIADHRIMAGVPCIRGTRIPVATIVGMVAEGIPFEGVISDFQQLTREDVAEALRYAALAVDERTLPLASTG